MIVAVEAGVLSSFILMRQNRMMRRGARQDHLNLQVDFVGREGNHEGVTDGAHKLWSYATSQDIVADTEIRDLCENTSIGSLS